jgi:biotin synthase
MALYPANSIFTHGYLTTPGATPAADHQMIRDAGFELELASGEAIPADPAAVATVQAPYSGIRLPTLRS